MIMKWILNIFGVLLILGGGVWALQGANIIRVPRSSFMIAQPEWIVLGSLTALVGAGLLVSVNRNGGEDK